MNTRYFGPTYKKKPDEIQVAVPVGKICNYCDEQIQADDMGSISLFGHVMHYECEMRLIAGSVGHQRRHCPCFGGYLEDPEGMTKHEAAQAALEEWTMQQVRNRGRQ